MNFDQYSIHQLAALISAASAEMTRRMSNAKLDAPKVPEMPPMELFSPMPSYDEQQHIADCLYLLKSKGFVRADDVREYRRIAKAFPQWMALKKFPDDVRGSSAARWQEKRGVRS